MYSNLLVLLLSERKYFSLYFGSLPHAKSEKEDFDLVFPVVLCVNGLLYYSVSLNTDKLIKVGFESLRFPNLFTKPRFDIGNNLSHCHC